MLNFKGKTFLQRMRTSISRGFVPMVKYVTISQYSACIFVIIHVLQLMGLNWFHTPLYIDKDPLYKIIFIILTTFRGRPETLRDLLGLQILVENLFYLILALVFCFFLLIVYVLVIFQQKEQKSQSQESLVKLAGYIYAIFEWVIYLPTFNFFLFFLSCGPDHYNGECYKTKHIVHVVFSTVGIVILTSIYWIMLYFQFIPHFIIKNQLTRQDLLTRYIRYLHVTSASILLRFAISNETLNYVAFGINTVVGLIYIQGISHRFEFLNPQVSLTYAVMIPLYSFSTVVIFIDECLQTELITFSVIFFVGGAFAASGGRVLYNNLLSKILVTNIDKLTSPRYLDYICRLLWIYLDAAAQDSKSSFMYISYVKNHIDICEDIACYCKKCNIVAEDYDKKGKGDTVLFDVSPEISIGFLEGFISYLYEKGVKKKFPGSFDLFMSFINFITEIQSNYIMAWLATSERRSKIASRKEERLLWSLRENIQNKIMFNLVSDDYTHHAPYAVALECENRINAAKVKIMEALKKYVDLFKSLDREQLDLSVIDKNCRGIVELNKKIREELYSILKHSEFSSQHAQEYYSYYMDMIVGGSLQNSSYQESDRYRRNMNLEDYFKEGVGVVLLSLDKGKLGKIEGATREFASMFGYKPMEIVHADISKFMPSVFGSRHAKFIERFLSYNKDMVISHESFISFGQTKDKFIIPITIRARVEIMNEDVYMAGFCDNSHRNRYFLILNNAGKIISVTQNIITRLNAEGRLTADDLEGVHIKCLMPPLADLFDNKAGLEDEIVYQDSHLLAPNDLEGLKTLKSSTNSWETKVTLNVGTVPNIANENDKLIYFLGSQRVNVFWVKFNLKKVVHPRSKIVIRVLELLSFTRVKDFREMMEPEDGEEVPTSFVIDSKQVNSKLKISGSFNKLEHKDTSPNHREEDTVKKTNPNATMNSSVVPENLTMEDVEVPLLGDLNNLECRFIDSLPDNKTILAQKAVAQFQSITPKNSSTNLPDPKKLKVKGEKSFRWKKLGLETHAEGSGQNTDPSKALELKSQYSLQANTFKRMKNMPETHIMIPSMNDDKKSDQEIGNKGKDTEGDEVQSLQVEGSFRKYKKSSKFGKSGSDPRSAFSNQTRDVIQAATSSNLPLFLRTFKLSGIAAIIMLIMIFATGFTLLYTYCDKIPDLMFLAEFSGGLLHPLGKIEKELEKRLMFYDGVIPEGTYKELYDDDYKPIMKESYEEFKSTLEESPKFYLSIVRTSSNSFNLEIEFGTAGTNSDFLTVMREFNTQIFELIEIDSDEFSRKQSDIQFFRNNTDIFISGVLGVMTHNFEEIHEDLDLIHDVNSLTFWGSVILSGSILFLIIPVTLVIRKKTNEVLGLFRMVPPHEIRERVSYYELHLAEFEKIMANEDLKIPKFDKLAKQKNEKRDIVKEKASNWKKIKKTSGPFLFSITVIIVTWGVILFFLLWQHLEIHNFVEHARPNFEILKTFNGIHGIYPNFVGLCYKRLYNLAINETNYRSTDYYFETNMTFLLRNLTRDYISSIREGMSMFMDREGDDLDDNTLEVINAVRETDMCHVLDIRPEDKTECENGLFVSKSKSLLAVLEQTFNTFTTELESSFESLFNATMAKSFVNSLAFSEDDKMQPYIEFMLELVIEKFSERIDNSIAKVERSLIACLAVGLIVYFGTIWVIWLPFVEKMNKMMFNARQNLLILPAETICNNKHIVAYFNREGLLRK